MLFDGRSPVLRLTELSDPLPGAGQLLLDVRACGVCRTDLHIVDGELNQPKLPLIPGHEVVGTVAAIGQGVSGFELGERVGVPWLAHTCGHCRYCLEGAENLCDHAEFTGYTVNGGYATRAVADAHYCFHLPQRYTDLTAAPLLCAGLIGYRTLRMAGDPRNVGLYGFGAAAHIIAQIARHEGRQVFAFTRPGDSAAQMLARRLGAAWAGGSDQAPPQALDAALLFAPVGALVPLALGHVRKGGIVVCGGIHMSDIPAFAYERLWGERRICSVANLTRADGLALMRVAARIPLEIEATGYALSHANEALNDLRAGRVTGAAVLQMT